MIDFINGVMWSDSDRYYAPRECNDGYFVYAEEFCFLEFQYMQIAKGWAFKYNPQNLIEKWNAKSECEKLVKRLNNEICFLFT